ncbi:glycosyltransferase family 9 protein [Streptomyces sp. bgisy153]|uniref:glycosyltransferase family 9 protein n=1 Tax=Streptomyces sp. bgisy153 TaxID=3413793 RepID=UPI003D70E460
MVLHPGASVPARAWSLARCAQVVRELGAAGHRVVFTGGPGERELTAYVSGADGLDLGGRTGAPELAGVLAGATAVATGNSLGRARTWDWPDSVVELPPERLRDADIDLVILQRPHELALVDQWLGRRPPLVYLEHNAPHGDVPDTRHPAADLPGVTLVHVTHFNRLMWDNGTAETAVVEHGIVDPGPRWTGELRHAAAVVNEPETGAPGDVVGQPGAVRHLPHAVQGEHVTGRRLPVREAEPAGQQDPSYLVHRADGCPGRAAAIAPPGHSGRGSQRNRRTATTAPAAPHRSSTPYSRQGRPGWSVVSAVSRPSLNGFTGREPAIAFSGPEWTGR